MPRGVNDPGTYRRGFSSKRKGFSVVWTVGNTRRFADVAFDVAAVYYRAGASLWAAGSDPAACFQIAASLDRLMSDFQNWTVFARQLEAIETLAGALEASDDPALSAIAQKSNNAAQRILDGSGAAERRPLGSGSKYKPSALDPVSAAVERWRE